VKLQRDYCDFALDALAIAEELNPEPIERVSGCRCMDGYFLARELRKREQD